ncbi:hypothetical protein MLD38_016323 [Melastoma candidum]|uniref:Uncharacterized protein n=1 Tax=Melastoma candidum TaxID=119954 RepID=A0ACB9RMS0_9MYRT|nr:hypothetical protein MLD38_016323 [Melastoma candidum]
MLVQYLFDSLKYTTAMKCGHTMHRKCLGEMLKRDKYCCPICSRSVIDISRSRKRLDEEIEATVMPDDYRYKKVWILCNDCSDTTEVYFHIIGMGRSPLLKAVRALREYIRSIEEGSAWPRERTLEELAHVLLQYYMRNRPGVCRTAEGSSTEDDEEGSTTEDDEEGSSTEDSSTEDDEEGSSTEEDVEDSSTEDEEEGSSTEEEEEGSSTEDEEDEEEEDEDGTSTEDEDGTCTEEDQDEDDSSDGEYRSAWEEEEAFLHILCRLFISNHAVHGRGLLV